MYDKLWKSEFHSCTKFSVQLLCFDCCLEYIINFFGLLQFQHFFSSFYAFQESTNDPRHTQFTESMCEDPVKEKQL